MQVKSLGGLHTPGLLPLDPVHGLSLADQEIKCIQDLIFEQFLVAALRENNARKIKQVHKMLSKKEIKLWEGNVKDLHMRHILDCLITWGDTSRNSGAFFII